MNKITFHQFKRIMSRQLLNKDKSMEIEFCVDNYTEYQESWLGKLVDKKTNKEVFWYGLTADGTQAYNFDSLDSFMSAKVFRGKSIEEIWDLILILSLNGNTIEEIQGNFDELWI